MLQNHLATYSDRVYCKEHFIHVDRINLTTGYITKCRAYNRNCFHACGRCKAPYSSSDYLVWIEHSPPNSISAAVSLMQHDAAMFASSTCSREQCSEMLCHPFGCCKMSWYYTYSVTGTHVTLYGCRLICSFHLLSRSFALHAWGNVLCPASGLPWALWNLMPFWSFCHLLSFHPEPCSVYNIDLAQSHSKFIRFTLFISIPTEMVENKRVDLGHRTASTAWCRKSTCLLQVSQGVYQESSWPVLAKDIKHSFAREWW